MPAEQPPTAPPQLDSWVPPNLLRLIRTSPTNPLIRGMCRNELGIVLPSSVVGETATTDGILRHLVDNYAAYARYTVGRRPARYNPVRFRQPTPIPQTEWIVEPQQVRGNFTIDGILLPVEGNPPPTTTTDNPAEAPPEHPPRIRVVPGGITLSGINWAAVERDEEVYERRGSFQDVGVLVPASVVRSGSEAVETYIREHLQARSRFRNMRQRVRRTRHLDVTHTNVPTPVIAQLLTTVTLPTIDTAIMEEDDRAVDEIQAMAVVNTEPL